MPFYINVNKFLGFINHKSRLNDNITVGDIIHSDSDVIPLTVVKLHC